MARELLKNKLKTSPKKGKSQPKPPCCKTCVFFESKDNTCRRYAPVITERLRMPGVLDSPKTVVPGMACVPLVDPTFWCGQHEVKPTPKAPRRRKS